MQLKFVIGYRKLNFINEIIERNSRIRCFESARVLLFVSVATLSPLGSFANSEVDDFNLRFSVPAPSGNVTTYLYLMNESLMIEKMIDRICVSSNQTKYSITRIPIYSIEEVSLREIGGGFSVVVKGSGAVDDKEKTLIDCSGKVFNPVPNFDSTIIVGKDEPLARGIVNKIREEIGVK